MRYTVPETLYVFIKGPCPEDVINRLIARGIPFGGYHKEDEFSASFFISGKHISILDKIAHQTQCEVEIRSRTGFGPVFMKFKKRAGFIVAVIILTICACFLQNRIWFLKVTGNTTIHEDAILRMLEEQEVGFGTAFGSIDMELLRNGILGSIPQLDYFTINTSGGFAEVVVRERSVLPITASQMGPKNLVSTTDGIIESVTVTAGTALVSVGDVVTEGQILISGVTDLEQVTVLSEAEGEVFARTFPRCGALREDLFVNKAYTGREKRCISFSFGKNTINFFKTSGISYDNYDKMTCNNKLTLPGGYELPISLTVSVFREYIPQKEPLDGRLSEQLLLRSLRTHVTECMHSGQILREELTLSRKQGCYSLTGLMECREEIGRSVEIKE